MWVSASKPSAGQHGLGCVERGVIGSGHVVVVAVPFDELGRNLKLLFGLTKMTIQSFG